MSNDTMVSEYPDEKQRAAICMQQARKDGGKVDQVKKVLNFEVKQIGLEDERMLSFTGSTEAEDRDGDIIEAYGWDLTDYQKNPVIMGFHEYDKFPYAKSTKTYIDYNAKQLKFEVKFPTISELTSFPASPDMIAEHAKNVDMAYNMYKNGYMSAVSVGFMGIDHEPMQDEQGNYKGRRYKKQSLLELSLVPVPSNPTALMEARSKGLISDKELKILQIEKAVVPYHKYALAPEGEAWDGPREISSASVEQLKIMSTWYDAENADNKGAYKLPHHKADGYTTVWRGVAAAMAALLGSRGGVAIPEVDKQGVYNHLAKHYKDFDKEPPEFKAYYEVELKEMFPKWPDELKEVDLLIDSNTREVFVMEGQQKTAKVNISDYYLEKFLVPLEQKAGAAISAKNMAIMEAAMEHMKAAMEMMQAMMGMMEDEPMQEACNSAQATMPIKPMKSAMRTLDSSKLSMKIELSEELKTVLDEIKSQVLLLSQKDAPKIIDLEAIEYTPLQKTALQDELNIEPEVLKNMIKEIISNNLQGGIQ